MTEKTYTTINPVAQASIAIDTLSTTIANASTPTVNYIDEKFNAVDEKIKQTDENIKAIEEKYNQKILELQYDFDNKLDTVTQYIMLFGDTCPHIIIQNNNGIRTAFVYYLYNFKRYIVPVLADVSRFHRVKIVSVTADVISVKYRNKIYPINMNQYNSYFKGYKAK